MQTSDNWKCEVCEKIFDNYRKLNGHKSSHQPKRRGKIKKEDGSLSSTEIREIRKNSNHDCLFCGKEFETGPKLGSHVRNCKERPDYNKIKEKQIATNQEINSRPEVREKISKSNKLFLQKNPHMVPYLRNHSSKKSFPEIIFENLLISNNIEGWKYNFSVGSYVFDFAFDKIKLDIEIDGSQHKLENMVKRDIIRDEFSKSIGWEVIRIEAKDVMQKHLQDDIIIKIKQKILELEK